MAATRLWASLVGFLPEGFGGSAEGASAFCGGLLDDQKIAVEWVVVAALDPAPALQKKIGDHRAGRLGFRMRPIARALQAGVLQKGVALELAYSARTQPGSWSP
jgi:hypothetical protein